LITGIVGSALIATMSRTEVLIMDSEVLYIQCIEDIHQKLSFKIDFGPRI
jgi:hypothetical protein